MINVLLVEDHELYRMGLSMLLSKAEDINLVAEAADGTDGIKKARDLAPAKISFKYLDKDNKEIETNIFDTPPLVEAYKKKLKESDAETQKSVQEILDGLAEDKYYHVNGNLVDENGKTYFKVTSIKNVPAELIMSNIYKSRFGIKEG